MNKQIEKLLSLLEAENTPEIDKALRKNPIVARWVEVCLDFARLMNTKFGYSADEKLATLGYAVKDAADIVVETYVPSEKSQSFIRGYIRIKL